MSRALAILVFALSAPAAVAASQPASVGTCVDNRERPAAIHLCQADRLLASFKPELRAEADHQRMLLGAVAELRTAAERGRGTNDFAIALRRLRDLYTPLYLNDAGEADAVFSHLMQADAHNVDLRLERAAMREQREASYPDPLLEGIGGLDDPKSRVARQLARFRDKWSQAARFARGGDSPAPILIKYVAPIYPDAARRAGIRGMVTVEARIDESGSVAIARIAESIPLLDQAALAAVRQWQYKVTTVNGQPAAIIAKVPVTFVP